MDHRATTRETVGRYRVLEKIGAGGMGVVYRARDERLGRDVAVKVLPPTFAADADRVRRFEREARAAATLGHPNILAIHDVDVHEGSPFIVTELLEGESLRGRIKGGSLTVRKSVELAIQIARGLAAAHDRGIVHRDIKPDNVFVTADGTVKLLDFGLAKLTQLEAPTTEVTAGPTEQPPTASGVALGTLGYMSPEQIRMQPVDARSDIFSFGCVLYEMLTRQRAFREATSADTAAAILSADPDPLPATIPSPVASVVRRCLEKRPDDRFQSARDVAFALQGAIGTLPESVPAVRAPRRRRSVAVRFPLWAALAMLAVALGVTGAWVARTKLSSAPLPPVKHLALMPLVPAGHDETLEGLAAGLTEILTDELVLLGNGLPVGYWAVPGYELRSLHVSERREAWRKFNITVALEGTLRRSGDRLRLDLASIDPLSDRVLRTATIEDSVGNLSAFQQEPVLAVARMLALEPDEKTRTLLSSRSTTMTAAFEAYAEALALLRGDDTEKLDRVVSLLERSVALDPMFLAGHLALGQAYLQKGGLTGDDAWFVRAEKTAQRMAGLPGGDVDATLLRAGAARTRGHLPEAITALENAAAAAPSNPETCLELARVYQEAARSADAERALERAAFLRPGYWPAHHRLGKLYLDIGRFEAAAAQFREVTICAPEFTRGYNNLGMMYYYLDRREDALAVFERSLAIEPSRQALSNLGTLYFEAARYDDAAAIYERALQQDDSLYLTWGNLAFAYHFGSSPSRAEDAFRRAAELAEARVTADPSDLEAAAILAGYLAMLGERDRGLEVLEAVMSADPSKPRVLIEVAESLWDLGEGRKAVEWIERALDAGVPRSRFEERPTLRDLVADEGYQHMIAMRK